MRRSKIIASLLWILLALYVCVTSFKLDLGVLQSPGPGFMPFLSGGVLCLLGFINLLMEWKNREEKLGWGAVNWGKIIIILIGIILYAALLQKLGFSFATFLVMVLFFKGIGTRSWFFALLSSLLTTLVLYLIFEVWLQSQFPKGILGI